MRVFRKADEPGGRLKLFGCTKSNPASVSNFWNSLAPFLVDL